MLTLALLFMTGLFAGTVDAIAGGGGLISLPVLLSLGMPPHLAFGTNKLQGMVGTLMAATKFYRHRLISLRAAAPGIMAGVLGSAGGAITVQWVSNHILQMVIPFLLLLLLIYTLFSPKFGIEEHPAKMREPVCFMIFGFALGFYDGFFGPGTGSFWVVALTFFLGQHLVKATAYTKLFNLNSSLVALVCFAIGGNIDYRLGLCMAAGQLIGGYLGAHLAIHKGARLIRPVFLGVVVTTILSIGYKTYL